MPIKKQLLIYEREKNKVKISGDPEDVKVPMWTDLILSHLLWIVPLTILLFIAPKTSFMPGVLQWLRKYLSLLILLVAIQAYLHFLLSG